MRFIKPTLVKSLSLLLALVCVVLLCACNGNNETPSDTDSTQQSGSATDGSFVVFADGEYKCPIMRPEFASQEEKDFYSKVRNIFKKVTGVLPPIETDFLESGEEYDSDKFEILVGSTNHKECSKVSSVAIDCVRGRIVGNKYILVSDSSDYVDESLETLESILNESFKGGKLVVSANWEFRCNDYDTIRIGIPAYEGAKTPLYYSGARGMETMVLTKSSQEEYVEYLDKLKNAGLSLYTSTNIGDNLFSTFIAKNCYVNTMYFPNTKEIRVTFDPKKNTDLPILSEENEYTATVESSITQIGMEDTTGGEQIGMSYVVKLADGSFLVIDGGFGHTPAVNRFMETLEELSDGADHYTIAAWVITHNHGDHTGLFNVVTSNNNYLSKLTIEQVIWQEVSTQQLSNMSGSATYKNDMQALYNRIQSLKEKQNTKVITAHPGQVFYLRNATYTVYTTLELVEPTRINDLNGTCVIGRVEIDGKTIMFPGDSDTTETQKTTTVYGQLLKSDAVQIIHHGHVGGTEEFAKLVDPITLFLPLGEDRYYYGSDEGSPMKDWKQTQWFYGENSKVQNLYLAGSEVTTILIKDLPSHSDLSE